MMMMRRRRKRRRKKNIVLQFRAKKSKTHFRAEDGEELRRRASSEVMWSQDACSTLAVLFLEEGPQLVDQGLVAPFRVPGGRVVVGVEPPQGLHVWALLGDLLQHL